MTRPASNKDCRLQECVAWYKKSKTRGARQVWTKLLSGKTDTTEYIQRAEIK